MEQKENVRVYFNKTSDSYSRVYDINSVDSLRAYIFLSRKNNVLNMLDKFTGRVLDIGCGPAVFTEALLKNGCEVWGIDISPEMITRAKKKIGGLKDSPNLHLATGDIERLDFPDEYFDSVLCVGVLEYLDDDSSALKEIYRVLKREGMAIFTVPNALSLFTLLDRAAIAVIIFFIKILSAIKVKARLSQNSLLFNSDIKDRYYYPLAFNKKLFKKGFFIDKKIFHVYRLSMLNALSPSLALLFARNMEWLAKTPICWMGINYIVRVAKR